MSDTELETGGNYQYRVRGEYHLFNPLTIQQAAACRARIELRDVTRNTRNPSTTRTASCARCAG